MGFELKMTESKVDVHCTVNLSTRGCGNSLFSLTDIIKSPCSKPSTNIEDAVHLRTSKASGVVSYPLRWHGPLSAGPNQLTHTSKITKTNKINLTIIGATDKDEHFFLGVFFLCHSLNQSNLLYNQRSARLTWGNEAATRMSDGTIRTKKDKYSVFFL